MLTATGLAVGLLVRYYPGLAGPDPATLGLFTAAVLTQDLRLLPVLCVAALPAWLLVTGRPEMLIPEPTTATPAPAGAGGAT